MPFDAKSTGVRRAPPTISTIHDNPRPLLRSQGFPDVTRNGSISRRQAALFCFDTSPENAELDLHREDEEMELSAPDLPAVSVDDSDPRKRCDSMPSHLLRLAYRDRPSPAQRLSSNSMVREVGKELTLYFGQILAVLKLLEWRELEQLPDLLRSGSAVAAVILR